MPDIHYIYLLIDPRDDQPRYVGQSSNPKRRLGEHLSLRKRLTPKNGWLNELKSQGLVPGIKVIEEFPFTSQEDADSREGQWIAHYGSQGWIFNRQESRNQREGFVISCDQDRGRIAIPDNNWGRSRSARWQIEDRTREMQAPMRYLKAEIETLLTLARTDDQRAYLKGILDDLDRVAAKLSNGLSGD